MTNKQKRDLKFFEIEDKPSDSYPTEIIPKREAKKILDGFFLSSGYLRIRKNRIKEKLYVKEYVVRFVARSTEELDLIRNTMVALNYKINKGYVSNSRFIQPLYNKSLTLKYKKLKDKIKKKR